MSDQDFSNREIVLMFEQIKTELSHIKDQTTTTNGRLLKVEDRINTQEKFQVRVITAWSVFLGIVTVALNKIF